jgi:hypothetical protein
MKYDPIPRWRDKVKKDEKLFDKALDYFNDEIESAHKDLVLDGNLSQITKNHAYYLSRYLMNAKDIEGLVAYFKNRVAETEAVVLREILDNPPTNTVPGVHERAKIAASDPRVIAMKSNLEEMQYIDKLYEAITDAWAQRGYSIAQLNKLIEHENMDAEI